MIMKFRINGDQPQNRGDKVEPKDANLIKPILRVGMDSRKE